ncbi:uncharacterized protein LOC134273473, partial [Saccostrea cucullata]|uniref:uncharacterized protein LOC134273473 n=1 Tax=Saccostrea cuccullata TaxID=36930 RepID=UPI002ED14EB6
MQNTFVILVLCFLLFDLKETSGKLNGSASGSKKTDKVRKGQLNPDDLNKKLLDVNSEEEDLAERMIVYIDGKKKKPKNLNKSPKNFELAQRMDTHPKRKMKPQLPQLPTRRKKRLFVPEDNLKWPNRQIPYSIQTRTYRNLGDIQQKFDEAVIKFNDAACVTWAPRTSESTYINVIGNEAT